MQKIHNATHFKITQTALLVYKCANKSVKLLLKAKRGAMILDKLSKSLCVFCSVNGLKVHHVCAVTCRANTNSSL